MVALLLKVGVRVIPGEGCGKEDSGLGGCLALINHSLQLAR